MGNVRFYLKEPKAEAPTLILAAYSYSNNRLKLSTGEKIHPQRWNPEKERVRFNRGRPEDNAINDTIDRYEKAIVGVYRKLIAKGKVDSGAFRSLVLIELNKKDKEQGLTFLQFFDSYYTELKKIHPYEKVKRFGTLYNHLETMYKVHPFSWNEINMVWYDRFKAYIVIELGSSKNYFAQLVKLLKMVLNTATDRELNTCTKYKSTHFRAESEQVNNIYLTVQELELIYNHDFSSSQKLDRVRDVFLVGCWTGMRYGDYSRLTMNNFTNDGFIAKDTTKVEGRVIIPIHPMIKEILEKYKGKLPKPITNARFNHRLKKIGEAVKINNVVNITRTEGGQRVTHTFKKWELISTHTARRTMATNMYKAGIPIPTCMIITGHSNVRQFLNYIKVTEQDVADSLVNHPFFTQKTPAIEPGIPQKKSRVER